MTGARVSFAVGALLLSGAVLQAQQTKLDPELEKIREQYQTAWAKGDAKTIAAMYATDAFWLDAEGQLHAGRAAIEQELTKSFAGTMKGTKITIRSGRENTITSDVRVAEGTYEISGIADPAAKTTASKGRYVNTFVRQQGRWLIAATGSVQSPEPGR